MLLRTTNRLTWNRTRDDRLEGGSYVRLTMSPNDFLIILLLGAVVNPYSTEGYNYDTQSIISGYRSALGRNPTQTEYVSEMAKLGYDPFNASVLGTAKNLSANVAALESDPFAGRNRSNRPIV